MHYIVGARDIRCPVYVVPDFTRPITAEGDSRQRKEFDSTGNDVPGSHGTTEAVSESRFFLNRFFPWTKPDL